MLQPSGTLKKMVSIGRLIFPMAQHLKRGGFALRIADMFGRQLSHREDIMGAHFALGAKFYQKIACRKNAQS